MPCATDFHTKDFLFLVVKEKQGVQERYNNDYIVVGFEVY